MVSVDQNESDVRGSQMQLEEFMIQYNIIQCNKMRISKRLYIKIKAHVKDSGMGCGKCNKRQILRLFMIKWIILKRI